MPVSLFIFDLDGTLVDTLADITESLNRALTWAGLAALSRERVKGLIGEGVDRLIEKAVAGQDPLANPELAGQIKKKFISHYSRHLLDHSDAYPGVPEVLRGMHGFKKAVISNKMSPLTRKILEGLGLAGHFDLVAGPEAAREQKPSAAPVLHVLDRLATPACDAVMVGDSRFDISAGRNAGVRCTVAVTYGYGRKTDLLKADYRIDSIEELISTLYRNEPMLERRKTPRD